MILDEKTISTLQTMGMTYYGARAYAALVTLGPAGAANVAEVAGIPRSKVYETLKKLESDGWVTIEKGRPLAYKARYPGEAIEERKSKIFTDIEYAASELSRAYDRHVEKEAPQVWLFRGMSNITARTLDMMARAKKNICMLGALYSPEEIERINRQIIVARKRGARVRILSREKVGLKEGMIDLPALFKEAAPEFRSLKTPFIKFVIVDGREIMIMFSRVVDDVPDMDATVAIWIPSGEVASLMESNFNMMWEIAMS